METWDAFVKLQGQGLVWQGGPLLCATENTTDFPQRVVKSQGNSLFQGNVGW